MAVIRSTPAFFFINDTSCGDFTMSREAQERQDAILNDIRVERAYQDKKWGTEFDDKNTANDWVAYITSYLGKAVTMPWDGDTYRTMLIKTAALCVAALEALDRAKGFPPERHYD